MKILICDAFAPSLPEKLKKFGEVTADVEQLPMVDVALVRSKTKCNREWLDKAKNLKLIIRGGVGMDNVDEEYANSKGIEASNTPQASSIAVAELTIALMLSVTSHIVRGHNGMVENKWLKKQCERTELYGKNLGLIGFGRIAHEVAVRAKAFGMEVFAYRRTQSSSSVATFVFSLPELLAISDYLSLHIPLTSETEKMINKETIAGMKDGTILINTARGECIVEQDVAEALQSGKLAGFGNDVWYHDPPPASPLIGAPNSVLTPHIGASSKENLLRIGDIIEQKIAEFASRKK